MPDPDFFMASTEQSNLEAARRCWSLKRIPYSSASGYLLLIRIEPVLIGQQFGLGATDVSEVLITPRHAGSSLFPINDWPLAVYVCRSLVDDPGAHELLTPEQVLMFGWAELYQTEREAQSIARSSESW